MVPNTKEYKHAIEIKSADEIDIKAITGTGICLTQDEQHVVMWYVVADEVYPTKGSDKCYFLVSDAVAKVTRRENENGTYAYGYVMPGPFVSGGKVVFPAGDIACPASMVANTVWTGKGYREIL